jgi:hypothetical protein
MNLIQIQEHLKDLPTQAIMAYANGKNPEVPPYMALGEMNRRKNMEQRAAQAPDSSVKEKLESELSQQIGLPGIRQGMNMRINPSGMPEPVPAAQPQMAPPMQPMQNPALARSMPAQPMSQQGETPGMADGGLAALPVDPDMFKYAPGGIVAFAEAGAVPSPELPEAEAIKLLKERMTGNSGVSEVQNPEDVRKKYIAEHPEQAAILNSLPGGMLTKLATTLEEQSEAQKTRFQEGEGRRGLAALSNALIAAGEATRGQKGSGLGAAFGGFGKAYNASTAEAEERAAKQMALERTQAIETMKLQSDVENLQRAYAEGNLAKIAEYEKAVRERKDKIAGLQYSAAKDISTMAELRRQHAETSRHNLAGEKTAAAQAAATIAHYNKPSTFAEQMQALKDHPELFAKWQGQSKAGTLTYEEALKSVNTNNATKYLDSAKKAALAQEMVQQSATVQSGKELPPAAAPAEDARSPYEKLMPEFMGGKAAPTSGVPQLPPGFVPVK